MAKERQWKPYCECCHGYDACPMCDSEAGCETCDKPDYPEQPKENQ